MTVPAKLRVLIVADPPRVAELRAALIEPFAQGVVEILISTGGDDTIDLYETNKPQVVVVTASLEAGDARSLIETLRGMSPRAAVSVVVIGDDTGPIRTALDAMELQPDRFVTRPLAPKALRYAVSGGIDQVGLARGSNGATSIGMAVNVPTPVEHHEPTLPSGRPYTAKTPTLRGFVVSTPPPMTTSPGMPVPPLPATSSSRPDLRARWAALADSMIDWKEGDDDGDDDEDELSDEDVIEEAPDEPITPMPEPLIIRPRRRTEPIDDIAPDHTWRPGSTQATAESEPDPIAPPREPDPIAPMREPTLIIREPADASTPPPLPGIPDAPFATTGTPSRPRSPSAPPGPSAATTPSWPPPMNDEDSVVVEAREHTEEGWSKAVPLSDLADRDSKRDLTARTPRTSTEDDLSNIDDFGDDDDHFVLGSDPSVSRTISEGRLEILGDLQPHMRPHRAPTGPPVPMRARTEPGITPLASPLGSSTAGGADDPANLAASAAADGRDFARQLRAKMSMMAQRLFQQTGPTGDAAAAPTASDLAPRHDHSTEIDLASLGEDMPLGGGVTEIESRSAARSTPDHERITTSPGTWDTQVRERGVPDAGDIVRGQSDAAMLLAKAFASQTTGHIRFKRVVASGSGPDGSTVEKIVLLDQGRPVFAASNEPLDRMGELLVREGKITASQYERCQTVVAESGRRMGEILVDLGYLKRRELLPAVRRHVEDILYSLFGWDSGTYHIVIEAIPSAERIRLSRHPAALVLEGIRRKYDRSTLERLVGPPSTVMEVPDRDRLGGIINLSDLSVEERAALQAIDGQVDLSQVARTAGVDVADLLPLSWGLVTLGLATARRTDTEVHDDSTALVGETDLAIDRERVRARWRLVTDADYFALLGVRRDATAFEIRRAYQSARRDFASDCFPSDLRRELAQELDDIASVLDEAFRVLRDDRLRVTYLSNLYD